MSFHTEVLLCLLSWKMKINEEKLNFHWPLVSFQYVRFNLVTLPRLKEGECTSLCLGDTKWWLDSASPFSRNCSDLVKFTVTNNIF